MLSGGQKSGGLSGEHIELCAEGARLQAESLRQTDRDAYFMAQPCVHFAVLIRTAVFIFTKVGY